MAWVQYRGAKNITQAIAQSQYHSGETVCTRWNGHFEGLCDRIGDMLAFPWEAKHHIYPDGARFAIVRSFEPGKAFHVQVRLRRRKPVKRAP